MRKYLLLLFFVSGFMSSQKKNKFSVELQGNTLSGIGNNFVTDGLDTFIGFGGQFQVLFIIIS